MLQDSRTPVVEDVQVDVIVRIDVLVIAVEVEEGTSRERTLKGENPA